ncbi:FtsX-like permease family protein [Tuanshanicoccus lijuaniae]|uniref:FtsX-like permease family protein n=1 Tax=Aerococcaceae bacterium zg-1292 TaxID=2774330 RepID=UPI001BD90098|nr:hypothetical protein [Aerococcaceae bacterium zg-A91]MBS4457181.1 hypothetical protein [Aerococcaceae bacterium zg-BR33]
MYYLWAATKNLLSQKKFYFLFCLQIILITCLVNILLGLNNGLQQIISKFSGQRQFDVLYLEGQNENGEIYNEFTKEDYQALHQLFPKVKMAIAKKDIVGIIGDDSKVGNYYIYETAGDFEALALSEQVNLDLEHYIYASLDFFKELENALKSQPGKVISPDFDVVDISLKDMWLKTSTGQKIPIYPFEHIPNLQNIHRIKSIFGKEIALNNFEENTHSLLNTIIASSKWNIISGNEHSISLGIKINKNQIKELQQILSRVKEKLPNYLFKYSSLKQQFNEKKQEIILISRTFYSILFICVVIIGISLIGLVSTFIDRRKSNISLCYLVGATKNELFIELLLELCLVVLLSGGIGILSSYTIVFVQDSLLGVPINLLFRYSLLIIFCQFIITVLITVILAKKYTAMNPIEILSEV